ncbi:hypothetical protein PT974_10398 [Cladobotryum mycophilum]|uniref:Uncharacterized protein n=1 Tax=Cladobotryum mycophilum TaxID=491253 RepID=A0ABR0S9R6_9HYPO
MSSSRHSGPSQLHIEGSNPSNIDRFVFSIITRYLERDPSEPDTSTEIAIRDIKECLNLAAARPRRGSPDKVVGTAVWRIALQVAKQIPVSDPRQGWLSALIHEWCQVWESWQSLEDFVPSLKDMFTNDNRQETKERVLNICAFIAHLGFKDILPSHCDTLAPACINLITATQSKSPDARVYFHLSALWMHSRGKRVLIMRRTDTEPELQAWLPDYLIFRPEYAPTALWQHWQECYVRIARKINDPKVVDEAADVVERMRLIVETWGDAQSANSSALELLHTHVQT